MPIILSEGADHTPDRHSRLRTLIRNGLDATTDIWDDEERADRIAGLIEQSHWLDDERTS